MKDYYKILGVGKMASVEEIKKRFRKKALALHPDKSGRDTREEFIELFEAYEILIDPGKRQRYDLIYDLIETPAAEQKDKELYKEILFIHEMGAGYAGNFKKFNREIILYIVLELIFSRFMIGAVAMTLVGICTIGKGIISLELTYSLIGVLMTTIGIWLTRLRYSWIMDNVIQPITNDKNR